MRKSFFFFFPILNCVLFFLCICICTRACVRACECVCARARSCVRFLRPPDTLLSCVIMLSNVISSLHRSSCSVTQVQAGMNMSCNCSDCRSLSIFHYTISRKSIRLYCLWLKELMCHLRFCCKPSLPPTPRFLCMVLSGFL